MVIEPSIGRVVEYWPGPQDSIPGPGPLAAMITGVVHDREIHIRVFGATSGAWTRTNVRLLQDQDQRGPSEAVAKWLDYQLGQAQKTIVAEAERDSGVHRQRLTEFYKGHLQDQILSANLEVVSTDVNEMGTLLNVDVQDTQGQATKILIPLEMVVGDGKPAVIASNAVAGALREIRALHADDGRNPPSTSPANRPAEVPPAPSREEGS